MRVRGGVARATGALEEGGLAYRRATPPGRGARHFLELLHEELAKHTHRGRFA